jgi:hypothetical protein
MRATRRGASERKMATAEDAGGRDSVATTKGAPGCRIPLRLHLCPSASSVDGLRVTSANAARVEGPTAPGCSLEALHEMHPRMAPMDAGGWADGRRQPARLRREEVEQESRRPTPTPFVASSRRRVVASSLAALGAFVPRRSAAACPPATSVDNSHGCDTRGRLPPVFQHDRRCMTSSEGGVQSVLCQGFCAHPP